MSRRLNTSELLPPSANQTDDVLCDLAIISVLDLRGRARETRKGEGGRTQDVSMSVYWTGSVGGAEGSGDF